MKMVWEEGATCLLVKKEFLSRVTQGSPKREEFTGGESWNVAYPGGILG